MLSQSSLLVHNQAASWVKEVQGSPLPEHEVSSHSFPKRWVEKALEIQIVKRIFSKSLVLEISVDVKIGWRIDYGE